MGQLVDLHGRMGDLLALIQAAAGGAGSLRVYDDPPVQLPETPCVFVLTPDEDAENVDTLMTRSVVTETVRLVVAAGEAQVELLRLADIVIATTDVWLRSTHPAPIDQARRTTMRGVTPVFNDVPTRGADFAVRIEADFRQTNV